MWYYYFSSHHLLHTFSVMTRVVAYTPVIHQNCTNQSETGMLPYADTVDTSHAPLRLTAVVPEPRQCLGHCRNTFVLVTADALPFCATQQPPV